MKTKEMFIPASNFVWGSRRSFGYSMSSAMADIIDNSISASANHIKIFAKPLDDTIYIIDNGTGMTEQELELAMTPHAHDPRKKRSDSDLGRFGLGLKTASWSQCTKLTVISKKNNKISAGIWDLKHIEKVNKFEMLIPDNPEDTDYFNQIGASGTLVVWENFTNHEGVPINELPEEQQNSEIGDLTTKKFEARSEIQLIFHRFLSGEEAGINKIKIEMNNDNLEPFDPFNASHPATQSTPVQEIGNGVSFQVYTLPHHTKVNREDYNKWGMWGRSGRAEGYSQNQGIYIYRQKRFLCVGTRNGPWDRIIQSSQLTNLTRVRLDFKNISDQEMHISADKTRIQLPTHVRNQLKNVLAQQVNTSRRVYRGRGYTFTPNDHSIAWQRVQKNNEISYQVNRQNPITNQFYSSLTEGLQKKFDNVLNYIESSFPKENLYADMGNNPHDLKSVNDEKDLMEWALIMYEFLSKSESSDFAIEKMKKLPVFSDNWEKVESLINSERN